MKRAASLILVAAVIFALAPTAAMAGGNKTIMLEKTGASGFDASGMAQITRQAAFERLYVLVNADLKDGTKVFIAVQRIQPGSQYPTWITVARAEVRLGTAVVDLNAGQPTITPVFPLSGIVSVRVMYKGAPFLQGNFR